MAVPPHVRSYVGIPLRTPDGCNVGALCAMDTRVRIFTASEIAILANFAAIVCDELQLRLVAQVDHLTSALIRRGFIEQAEREIARAHRYNRPGALVMIDVDHFKSVNDAHGHPAGDQVLRQLAEIAATALRDSDVFGRLGGEEFAMLLPETNGADAVLVAERLRQAIADHAIHLPNGETLRITASFGVAVLAQDSTFSSWLERADAMLYAAKAGGRNRIRPAEPV